MIKFSLVLCTLNRAELLRQCVTAILEQSHCNFELIIVDQSDMVNTEPYMSDPRITYVHIKHKGLSNARNTALKYVTGDYVCLVDDDAVYSRDWLQTVASVIEEDPSEIISGRIKDPLSGEFGLKGKLESRIDSVNYRNVMDYGISPCCVFRADALIKIGFDDRFGVGRHWGAGEETDVIWSIMENNGRMKYAPQIVVVHPCPSKEIISLNKIASYNLGFGAMFAKHRRNPHVLLFCIESLMRNVLGGVYYLVTGKPNLYKIQYTCLKNKIQGFKEYLDTQKGCSK